MTAGLWFLVVSRCQNAKQSGARTNKGGTNLKIELVYMISIKLMQETWERLCANVWLFRSKPRDIFEEKLDEDTYGNMISSIKSNILASSFNQPRPGLEVNPENWVEVCDLLLETLARFGPKFAIFPIFMT